MGVGLGIVLGQSQVMWHFVSAQSQKCDLTSSRWRASFMKSAATRGRNSRGIDVMSLPDLSVAFSKSTSAPATPIEKTELTWQILDVTSLSPDLQQQYNAYKQAEEAAVKARKVFEKAMSIKLDLPPHLILRFGYRFGRLAVALDTDQRSRPRAASLSLEGLAHAIDRRKA